MCDEIDALNERAAREAEWRQRDREVMEARRAQHLNTFCENCEDDLPQLRIQLHCARCIECQRAFERRSHQYREVR